MSLAIQVSLPIFKPVSFLHRYTNNFEIVGTWLGAVPGIAYALLAGALSDRYGRMPLLVLPWIGYWISIVIKFINYAYIR